MLTSLQPTWGTEPSSRSGTPPPPRQRTTSGAPSTAPNPHTLATEALSLRGPQSWAAVPAGSVLGLRQQQAPTVQAASTEPPHLPAQALQTRAGSQAAARQLKAVASCGGPQHSRPQALLETCVSDSSPHLKRWPLGNGVPPGVQGRVGEGGQTARSLQMLGEEDQDSRARDPSGGDPE